MERIILLTLLAVTIGYLILARMAVKRIEHAHYLQRADLFRNLPIQNGDIVFLGDSITAGGCWDELFPGLGIKNRGINADDTRGVLARLDDILTGHPRALFILIGTNDLNPWNYHPETQIIANYEMILKRCQELSPETKVYIESVLPRSSRLARRVQQLNQMLEELAAKHERTFINLYPHFADENGALRSEFNNDHLHLLSAGYAQWVQILTPYLEPYRNQ